MITRFCTATVSLLLVALALTSSVSAQGDWSQWRGSKLDSVAHGEKVVGSLDDTTKLWRTELPGSAGSSPIVVGDRVIVTSVSGDDQVVLCLDTATGVKVWANKVAGESKDSRDGANSASNSPCSDGKHVWTMFGNGQVNCFTIDGKPVWDKNLQDEYGKFEIMFGMATTPVLHEGQLLISLIDGSRKNKKTSVAKIVSLDAATGKENWVHVRKTDATDECKQSYASPTIANTKDGPQLIVHGADYTTAHQLDDGAEIWRLGGMNPRGDTYNPTLRFVSSPVAFENTVVVPSAKRRAIWAVATDQTGELNSKDTLWQNRNSTPDVACPVVYDGLVFLARENGTLVCLDFKNGETLTAKRLLADKHRSTPVAVDGKIVVVDRKGVLMMLEANKTLDKISSIDLKEETTASPAISNGRLFVRTFDALYAFGSE